MPQKETDSKDKRRIVISYFLLRKIIGFLGISLPFIFIIGSYIIPDCGAIHKSISDYYHTPLRDIFVGILCAVAIFLFVYRGYEPIDNKMSSLGGIFALCVAFFPTSVTCPLNCNIDYEPYFSFASKIHFFAALGFFGVLIYITLFLFVKSGTPKKEDYSINKKKKNLVFKICGYTMLLCVLGIAAYFQYVKHFNIKCHEIPVKYNVIFFLEGIALVAFGVSWLIKGEFIWKDVNSN